MKKRSLSRLDRHPLEERSAERRLIGRAHSADADGRAVPQDDLGFGRDHHPAMMPTGSPDFIAVGPQRSFRSSPALRATSALRSETPCQVTKPISWSLVAVASVRTSLRGCWRWAVRSWPSSTSSRSCSHLLETARDLTGARYAALGILDEGKRELERFLTIGVDDETRKVIGPLPRGHGVLGELIRNPEPLRLHDVTEHPRSYGFPAGHPPMTTFLGVPVAVRGEAYGNLYLTDKAGGEDFTEKDEELLVVLSEWAAVAIYNARLYESTEQRRRELERAVRGLEATATIARAVGFETELDRVLELIVKRGRAMSEARAAARSAGGGKALMPACLRRRSCRAKSSARRSRSRGTLAGVGDAERRSGARAQPVQPHGAWTRADRRRRTLGARRPARVPRQGPWSPGRVRSDGKRRAVRHRRRTPTELVRGERRDRDRNGSVSRSRPAAPVDASLRGRAGALGT